MNSFLFTVWGGSGLAGSQNGVCVSQISGAIPALTYQAAPTHQQMERKKKTKKTETAWGKNDVCLPTLGETPADAAVAPAAAGALWLSSYSLSPHTVQQVTATTV